MKDGVVRVWLKVADPTALTARETLEHTLGYGSKISQVARSEVWAFRWEEAVEPRPLLERLLRETNLLANPNKHRVELAVGADRLVPRGNVWVLVHAAGDGAHVGRAAARHGLLPGEAPRTARGTLWEIGLEVPEAERARVAEEIAVVHERSRGLLANPHREDAQVFTEPPSAASLVNALGLTHPPSE